MQEELLKRAESKGLDVELIRKAYEFAQIAHKDQKRVGGDPYFTHLHEVASILLDSKYNTEIDTPTIVAALLHDTLEDTKTTHEDLVTHFSTEIAQLVDSVSKIEDVQGKTDRPNTHSKWLEEGRKDKRVFSIKLADIMHNLRTLGSLTENQQIRMATEAIAFHVPIAKRMKASKFEYDIKRLANKYLKK